MFDLEHALVYDDGPRCECCETEQRRDADGEWFCPICSPRCDVAATPVRASFSITDGIVTELAL